MSRLNSFSNKAKHATKTLSAVVSGIVLFATAFSTPALAEVKGSLEATASDAISYDASTKTVTINGDCTTDAIYAFMHDTGEGADAETLHFAGTSVIKTLQYDPTSEKGPDPNKGPFANSKLVNITAEPNAHVSFTGKDERTAPVLTAFFNKCKSLFSLDGLSAWNVSNVTGRYCMHRVFEGCSSLLVLKGLSAWDVSQVTGSSCLSGMFDGCTSVLSLDDLYAWDVSNITEEACMAGMFYRCSSLTTLDGLSAWDVSSVTGNRCMAEMFAGCSSLTSLDGLSAWVVSKVSGEGCMNGMFSGCSSLTSLDGLSAWDVSSVEGDFCMGYMFDECTSLTSLDGLSAWDVSKVSGEGCMNYLFYGCSCLTSLDGLSAWDVSNVMGRECMRYMLAACSGLTSLEGLSAWDVSNITGEACMDSMFIECTALTSLDGLSAWDVANVQGDYCMAYMFADCTKLESIDALASWNIQNALDPSVSDGGVYGMFTRDGDDTFSSVTVSNTFTLSADMFLNWDDEFPPANWWPVDATNPSAVAMSGLATASKNTAANGYRWQKCSDGTSSNPMRAVTNLSVSWPVTSNLTYNGLFQTVTPTVTADGAALKEGADFYVRYRNNASAQMTNAIKDAGTYTATVNIRGAFTYAGTPQTTQVIINKLDLNRTTNPPAVYTVPTVCEHTGSAIEPKTMVRLYLRDDENPTPGRPSIPIYTYLVENTSKRKEGDFRVSYANNVNPGIATVTVNPAIPAGHTSSNLEGSATANFTITTQYLVTFDSNGGSAVEPQEVTSGQTAIKPDDPTKDGYTFGGWFVDQALMQAFDFATPITTNLTLYAKWESIPGPTPEPTPSSDGTLIPTTGDSTSMTPAVFALSAAVLISMAALGLAMNMRIAKRHR